jgi:hypothetical protein
VVTAEAPPPATPAPGSPPLFLFTAPFWALHFYRGCWWLLERERPGGGL